MNFGRATKMHFRRMPLLSVTILLLASIGCRQRQDSSVHDATTSESSRPPATSTISPAETRPSPARQPLPQLVQRLGHAGAVHATLLTKEGQYAVTGGRDNSAILWDMRTGGQLRTFVGHVRPVHAVAVSDDFQLLATAAYDGSVGIWDLRTGRELRTFGVRDVPARTGERAGRRGAVQFTKDLAFLPGTHRLILAKESRVWTVDVNDPEKIHTNHAGRGIFRFSLSPSGTELLTLHGEGVARVWKLDDFSSIASIELPEWTPSAAAWCTDSRHIVIGSRSGDLGLWDTSSNESIKRFGSIDAPVSALACAGESSLAIAAPLGGSFALFDISAQQRLASPQVQGVDRLATIGVTSDGTKLLTGSFDGSVDLWDPRTTQVELHLPGQGTPPRSVAWSTSGNYFALGLYTGGFALWRTTSGDAELRSVALKHQLRDIAFAGAHTVLTAGGGAEPVVSAWDVESGKHINTLQLTTGVAALAPLPNVPVAVIGTGHVSGRRTDLVAWNWQSNTQERLLKADGPGLSALAASTDGLFLVIGRMNGAIEVRDARSFELTSTAELTDVRGDVITDVAISPDGSRFAAANRQGIVGLFTTAGVRLWTAQEPWGNTTVSISASSRVLAAGLSTGDIALYSTAEGRELARTTKGGRDTWALGFAPNDDWLLSAHADGTARVWDTREQPSGKVDLTHSLTLLHARGSDWAVVSPSGQFDTTLFEDKSELGWEFKDKPFEVLPFALFMQNFFEPRLLARVLARDAPPQLRSVANVNPLRPKVSIDRVTIHPCTQDACTVDRATVQVTVRSTPADPAAGLLRDSGAFDLRLLRNGKIVKQKPEIMPVAAPAGSDAEETAWRNHTSLLKPGVWSEIITLTDVPVPNSGEVSFSAYAFNEDRIKSDTFTYQPGEPLVSRSDAGENSTVPHGRAFVLAIGVNEFSDSKIKLRHPVPDAELMLESLMRGLERTGKYSAVAGRLLTAPEGKPGVASKEDIRNAIESLSGHANGNRRSTREIGDQSPLGPRDAAIIFFATHGYRDYRGEFYLFPQDISLPGAPVSLQAIRSRGVSSQDLRYWLRELDAKLVTIIIDACQSAAAVQALGFKPAPAATRGFGQLAFDKRMLVLAGARAEDDAFESKTIGHGLLTFALINRGLAEAATDYRPADGFISAFELLASAERQVPRIYMEISQEMYQNGKYRFLGKKPGTERSGRLAQQPVFFAFVDRKEDMPFARTKKFDELSLDHDDEVR